MIKSLLESDENQPEEIKPETEKITVAAVEKSAAPIVEINELEEPLENSEARFDAPAASEFRELTDEEMFAELFAEKTGETANSPDSRFDPIENTASRADRVETLNFQSSEKTADEAADFNLPAAAKTEEPQFQNSGETLFQSSVEPESFAETARKSGLAYAAAITLFGSVVFMLIIGWFADLLLGSSPWGIVGGIVLGAAIGFFQFFRLTSQIFKNKE